MSELRELCRKRAMLIAMKWSERLSKEDRKELARLEAEIDERMPKPDLSKLEAKVEAMEAVSDAFEAVAKAEAAIAKWKGME